MPLSVIVIRIVLSLFWCFVAVLLFSATFEAPLSLTRTAKLRIFTLAPEGWAFFTKDPQLPTARLYKLRGSQWVYVDTHNADPRNGFGISRRARKLDLELAAALNVVKPKGWVRIRLTHAELAANTELLNEAVISNTAPNPVLCGRFLVEERPPVPWAWSGSNRKEMPGRAVKLRAVCS